MAPRSEQIRIRIWVPPTTTMPMRIIAWSHEGGRHQISRPDSCDLDLAMFATFSKLSTLKHSGHGPLPSRHALTESSSAITRRVICPI